MDTPDIKTDAEKTLADTKATIAGLEEKAQAGESWIRAHTAWLIGGGMFLAGIVVGHFLK
jgi:hypothetical protein